MGQFVVCSRCNRILETPDKGDAEKMLCPGCQCWILIPPASAGRTIPQEEATKMPCPKCGRTLKLVRQLAGMRVRCNTCQTSLLVSIDPWKLTAAGGPAVRAKPTVADEGLEESQAPLFLDDAEEVQVPSATESRQADGDGSELDAEVAAVVGAWPHLPHAMRVGILAMIRAVSEEHDHSFYFLA